MRMRTSALYKQRSHIGQSDCSRLPLTKDIIAELTIQIFTHLDGHAKKFSNLKRAVNTDKFGDPCSILIITAYYGYNHSKNIINRVGEGKCSSVLNSW